MGHYLAEMMCDRCGRVDCRCPPPPDPDRHKWIVDLDDETPILVADFDKKQSWLYRIDRKKFKTKKEAEAHAVELLEQRITSLELHLTATKTTIIKAKDRLRKLKKSL